MKQLTPDEIFDIVERSCKHGDSIAIQLMDRVFVVDLDELPDGGVPADGTFVFKGWEVLPEDLGHNKDGSMYLENTEPMKTYEVVDYKIIEEHN